MNAISSYIASFGSRKHFAGIAFVFLFFLLGSSLHFVKTDTEVSIMPPYIPYPYAAVIVSGVFELLGAIGLLFRRTRCYAGIGLFLLTIAVSPVHIYMLQYAERFPAVPYWALVVRIPLQLLLLWLIAWSVTPSCRTRLSSAAKTQSRL